MPTSTSPWGSHGFRTLFTASALSNLGASVGYVAVPLTAVLALDAEPGQVGLLATLSTAAFLLIGLPAGAWVDRMRVPRVLVAADLARAALFGSIPVAWACGTLTLGQLYAVALLGGAATVFFDVGAQTHLPAVTPPDALVRGNSAVVSLQAVGNIAGRGAGGGLVQVLTAPVAVLAAAALYLASALGLTGLAKESTPRESTPRKSAPGANAPGESGAAAEAPTLRTQIAEGLRHVLGDRELRALAVAASLNNLGGNLLNTLLPVLFTRELGLPAWALGAYLGLGGLGVLIGATLARPMSARLGYGRTLGLTGLLMCPTALLIAPLDRGWWLPVACVGWLLCTIRIGISNVLGVALRQRLTPDPLLGRMNATFRFMLTGALAVGAAAAGLLGQFAGLHTALWLGAAILAVSALPVHLSPVRHRTTLPDVDSTQAVDGAVTRKRAVVTQV
ncbi:MFS transporter [Yinghuangia seranimata]|uniref:MFS transporter n=1 Tax=Yinghuangia seranimata TaxID=408067 RepID=UPI00248C5C57|nr:MFS transporter [Yinghuangia seranimata]MDI2129908.1 MFS transporter [Yinghuangia seranimata]